MVKKITTSNGIIAIILLLYFIHPRINAHSFYNIKDSVFLSLFFITSFIFFQYLRNQSTKILLLFAVCTSFTINSRIMGLLIPVFYTFWIFFLNKKKSYAIFHFLLYVTALIFSLYIITPIFWQQPLQNFILTFRHFSSYSFWKENVIFAGQLIKGSNLPFYYIPIWIIISTPIAHLFIWFLGGVNGIYEIHNNKSSQTSIYIAFSFYVILLSYAAIIIFHSTLYDDWRHLYYLFPFLIIIGTYALDNLNNLNKKLYIITIGIVCLSIVNTTFWMIRNHPHYYVYFNIFAGKHWANTWDRDTWRLSSKQIFDYFNNTPEQKQIKILNNPYLSQNKNMLPSNISKNIVFVSSIKNAEYIIADYRYIIGNYPRNYYNGFLPIYSVIVDDNVIMTLYKRII